MNIKAIELKNYNHKVVEYWEDLSEKPNLGIVEDCVLYEFQNRNEVFLGHVVWLKEYYNDLLHRNKSHFKDKIKESFYYNFSFSHTLQEGFGDAFEKSQDGKVFVPFRSSMELKELMTEQLSEFYDEIEKMEDAFYTEQDDFGWTENYDDEPIYRYAFEDYVLHYKDIIYGQESDELPF